MHVDGGVISGDVLRSTAVDTQSPKNSIFPEGYDGRVFPENIGLPSHLMAFKTVDGQEDEL